MRKIGILLLIVFSQIWFGAAAMAEKAPLTFDAFDGQPVGARAISLGEAFAGLSNDANAAYWNPAGMALMPSNSFTACSYLQRTSDAKFSDVVNTDPLRGGKLVFLSFASSSGGLSVRPLSKISLSSHTNENGVETFTDQSININEISFTAAKKYQDNLYTGVSLNYINSNLALSRRTIDSSGEVSQVNADTGNGWSLDAGILYAASEYLTFGLSARNAIGYLYWSDFEKNKLPLTLRGGMALSLPQKMTFTYDYAKVYYPEHDDITTKHVGLEQILLNMFVFRAGISGEDWNDPLKVAYTFGLGFSDKGYGLDVAMKKNKIRDAADPDVLDQVLTYIVSINLPFGQSY